MALAFNGSDVFTSVVKNLCLKYTEHKDVDLSGVRSLAFSAKGGKDPLRGSGIQYFIHKRPMFWWNEDDKM